MTDHPPASEPTRALGAGGHRLPAAPARGGRPATEAVTAAGEPLGPYRLLERVGEGGMGVVHRAVDTRGRTVAVKVLRAHVAHDSGARARLRREVASLSRVRSPDVAEVIDADVDGERPYLVTRFVPGPPLDEVVEEHGPVTGERLVDLGRGLARALTAIHRAGVVHRDVKPGNVLMDGAHPVLIDFGIAHVADDVRLTSTGLVMGTPGYLSPEIVEGAPVTEATDWWGWAATLAYAASGHAPFGRGPMPVVLDRVTRGQADLSGVDDRLRPLLAAALSPDPRERPSTGQVLQGMQVYAGGGHTGTISIRPRQTPPTRPVAPPAGARPDPTRVQPRRAPNPTQVVPGPQQGAAQSRQGPYQHVPQPGQSPYTGVPAGPAGPAAGTLRSQDPRIGQSARTGTLAAAAAAVVGLSAIWPVVAVILLLLWTFAARWTDRAVTSMVLRRYSAGRRRSDGFVAVASSPWHAVTAAFSTVLSMLVPLFVGACADVTVALALALAGSHSADPAAPVPVAAGVLVICWVLWWGPGGTSMRRGSRSIVRGVVRGAPLTRIITGLLLVLAAVGAVWGLTHLTGAGVWWPLTGSPGGSLNSYLPTIPGR